MRFERFLWVSVSWKYLLVLTLFMTGFAISADAARLAMGTFSTTVLKDDGTVLAWGNNMYGQVGDGTGAHRWSPVHVVDGTGEPIQNVQAVAFGSTHMIALQIDGRLLTWGANSQGQLGDGTTTQRLHAVRVIDESENPFDGIVDIAAASNQSVALKSDGTLWSWGYNLSLNDIELHPIPVLDDLGDPVTGVKAICGGGRHFLALKEDGTLLAWGINSSGQLGDGTTTYRGIPRLVLDESDNPISGIKAISAGSNHSIAITLEGNLLAWGLNSYGQLGDGTTTDRLYPAPVLDEFGEPLHDIRDVSGGGAHTIALMAGGVLQSWGANESGQLGDGTKVSSSHPVTVIDGFGEPVLDAQSIAAGGQSSVIHKTDGSIWAWGSNRYGQLGDGTVNVDRLNPVPVLVFALNEISDVKAGGNHSFALKADGTLLSWGSNGYGQLGDGTTIKRNVPDFVIDVSGDAVGEIESLAVGTRHVLAVKADGTILSWGGNEDGQLGDGATTNRYYPGPVVDGNSNLINDIQQVSAGRSHSMALKADGSILAWGDNSDGQLGNGTTVDQVYPLVVVDNLNQPITGIKSVSAGTNHSLAVKTDGTVLAWGANYSGQLGDGTTEDRYNPVPVLDEQGAPITGVKEAYAGGIFSVALKTDGTLLAWGWNSFGRLGDGTTIDRHNPVPVLANELELLSGIESIAIGDSFVLAIQSGSGTMFAWGNNYYGQLGNNETSGSNPYPVAVLRNLIGDPATGFRAASAGITHSIALLNDSILYREGVATWGRNFDGQLGDGSNTDKDIPNILYSGMWWLNPQYGSHLYQPLNITDPIVVDTDGDSIVDIEDNCPDIYNPDQSDVNGNGIGDACDISDADGDGVADSFDNCPSVANSNQSDVNNNGIGDACDSLSDTDGDGLADNIDPQPSVYNSPLDDKTAFVRQVYLDFLNREPDIEGLNYWVSQLDSGALDRSQVVEQYLLSPEFGQTIAPVARLYFAYFLRIPDYGGLMYWIEQYKLGLPLVAISEFFASSEEFTQRYGSLTNSDFVTLVYQNVLGRDPDLAGLDFWTNELDSATRTRGEVMVGFSESPEYQTLMYEEIYVTMTYIGLLRRAPEQGGFDYWVGAMEGGASGLALIDGFLASNEYADRFAGLAPLYAFGTSYLQYRVYESGSTTYQAWLPMTKDGVPIQESDIFDIRFFDSQSTLITPTIGAFQAQNFMHLNCTVEPCFQSGPVAEHAYWIRYPYLAADTYSFEVDTSDGQTLTNVIPYPGQLALPIVTAGTMQSSWDGNNLVLSWENPVSATNWLDVDKLRISLYDGTGNVVLNIQMNPTAQAVTLDADLLLQAIGLGDGLLESWEVQTRAYDASSRNFARSISFRLGIATP